MRLVKCVQCGVEIFQKTAQPRKYCSTRCRDRHHYWQDPKRYNAYSKKFYYAHQEYNVKRAAEWAKKNPERAKEQNNRATRKYKEKIRYENKKQLLLEKYGGCQKCGSKKRLQLHHIDRVSYHNSPKPNNKLENLMLLCQTCHLKGHWAEGNFRVKRKSDTLGN